MGLTGQVIGPILRPIAGPPSRPGVLLAWLLLATLGSGALAGCGTEEPARLQLPQGALALQRIDWGEPLPALTGPGNVAAVAEAGDDTAIFGDTGLYLWSSGSTAGSDGSVRSWRAAAAVPALGFPGQWLIGVDDSGRIYRVHTGTTFGLEDVTARYVLTGKPVREVVALGSGQVAFALEGKLAVTDGQDLKLYDLQLRNLVGGPTRLAAYDESGVTVWDAQSGALRQLAQPGVLGVAFAPDGQLWAATASTLYTESKTALVAVHEFAPPQVVTGLAGAARGVWVGLSDTLALLRAGQLLVPATSPMLPAASRLVGSVSGDVWAIAGSPGSPGPLVRYGEESGGGRDLMLWRQKLVPVFSRLCQSCHLPGGSAHIDMSTYSSWVHLRAAIAARVVERKPTPMPPVSVGELTAQELADVKEWVARMP